MRSTLPRPHVADDLEIYPMQNRILVGVFALILATPVVAQVIVPEHRSGGTDALAIIYEDDFAFGGAQRRDEVAAFAANGLSERECDTLAESINATGGFAACFADGADASRVPPLVELDPVACRIAEDAPTDINLFRCYGDLELAHW